MDKTVVNSIRASNLQVCYANVKVLRGVDLAISDGEFVAVVGESGCGKSTLLHALSGFIESIGELHVPKKIGMVFQNHSLFPWMTVGENIESSFDKMQFGRRREIVDQYLQLVDLEEHKDKYPAQLSGGQVQRIAVARALASNAKTVFMDEPFAALDTMTRERMQRWIFDLWRENNTTFVFVTHNIDEALFLATRCIIMRSGKINSDFPVKFSKERNDELRFSDEFIQMKKRVVQEMTH